jgi:hypothetical protein
MENVQRFIFVEPIIRNVLDKNPKTIMVDFVNAIKQIMEPVGFDILYVFICPESHLKELKENNYLNLFLSVRRYIMISDLNLIFNTKKSIYNATQIQQCSQDKLPQIVSNYSTQLPIIRADDISLIQNGIIPTTTIYAKNDFNETSEVFYFNIN